MKCFSKLILSTAFIIVQLLSSCSDDITYSCDSNQNNWVKSHLEDIKSMHRIDWLNIDGTLGIPVYRAFSANQKLDFWSHKFNEVQQLNWNKAELEHIKVISEYINSHPQLFCANIPEKDIDDFDIFIYNWCNWAYEHLGWTDSIIYSITGCGNKVLDTNGNIKPLPIYKDVSLLAASEKCNCSTSASIYCPNDQICEKTGGKVWCNTTDGCGHFLIYECNGECIPK